MIAGRPWDQEVGTTTRHLPHLLMLAVPLALFAGIFALEWRGATERPARPRPDRLVLLMAAAALGSLAVHVAVVREHFAESALLGWFFVLLSGLQLGYVLVLIAAPVRRVVVGGVLGHLAVIALWAWTRSVGVPFGQGGVEAIGSADLLATALEALCVLAGLAAIYRATGGRPSLEVLPLSEHNVTDLLGPATDRDGHLDRVHRQLRVGVIGGRRGEQPA